MNAKRLFFPAIINLLFLISVSAQENLYPTGLTVNLLSNPQQVFQDGYLAITPLEEAVSQSENFQFVEITSSNPTFGWIINSSENNTMQTGYRILVATNKKTLAEDIGDAWDSGKVNSDESVNISYKGKVLEPGKVYFWKVKIWDNHGHESQFSEPLSFKTADAFVPYLTDRYPIQKQDEKPNKLQSVEENRYLIDFGKAAFGRLRINLYAENDTDSIIIHLGEAQKSGRVDRNPGGTIRYSTYTIKPKKGRNTYLVTIKPDRRNTGKQAIRMPEYIGEVTPFRYCEIKNYKYPLSENDVTRETVFYPFNESESYFHSSDTVLNQVWDLCKYSVKATSFTGVYIDGDRERIPYEADALINQLSHYCVAREYSIARYSHEYLIEKPTWPTEWILQSVLMAWEDYMYTGNKLSLQRFYSDLKAKTLTGLSDENGFISTQKAKVTPEILESIHFNGELRDIVDWPHTGILGLEKSEGGETDGFVFTEINTVVNAFHYRTLTLMSKIAEALGNYDDKEFYSAQASRLKKSFNDKLFDQKRGVYIDGIGTKHASLHANMFPLAFGLVPEKNTDKVTEFIRSRKMACSVYGSQFLLDGIYNANDAEYGLKLLTSTSGRSWYNMIRSGSTISMEAWDNKYKPNQDWNHAWGAAPANLIPRKLMGIEPLEPGFRKVMIKPLPASLKSAEIKHPTIRGDIIVRFNNEPGKSFTLEVSIPANTTADVYLPFYSSKQKISINNRPTTYRRLDDFSVLENIGSGKWIFTVNR